MEEKIVNTLEQLAAQLETTVEFLWGVLLKQAYVSAVTYAMWLVILLVGFIVLVVQLVKSFKPYESKYKDGTVKEAFPTRWAYWADYGEGGLAFGMCAMFSILFTILIAAIIGCTQEIATALLNPEYWALENILSKLSGK